MDLTLLKQNFKKRGKYITNFIRNNLYITLGAIFIVLLGLILAGNLIRQTEKPEVQEKQPVSVDIYQIGEVPRVTVLGNAEKENVNTLVAQTSGVVQNIYVREGSQISADQSLAYISTNYQGDSAPVLNAQIAQKQYQHTKDTFDLQKDLIKKQKEVAKKNEINSDKLREINENSVQETENLIELNNEIIDYLNENIDRYQATDSADKNRDLIAATKQSKTQYLSANNQLKSSLRSLNYSKNEDNPPAKLADLQKNITLKQLDLQEKSLALNLEVSRLQYQLAQVNQCLAYPSSVHSGVVQKVFVKRGQAVSPGTPLFVIAGPSKTVKVTAEVSKNIAENISMLENSILFLDEKKVEMFPDFVSTEPTRGTMHNIKYTLAQNYAESVKNGENITISIPVGYPDTGSTIPFIPIDAVYQSNSDSFVFLAEDSQVVSQKVELGNVYGGFVSVLQGLQGSNQIILNRNVVEGDQIRIK